ncbi:MAG: mercury(II) reductase [Rhizobiales bacterium]|nr:mercury(II) reductase [Hyphomicrobiales bacterium]MBO6697820.1 mercury(II) reductase [Hyphomicrobiales bacterium]MBO6735925.1 mercury(II) reductase [Hyphomicrobiales bacterium]MBO6912395.1 mercury(II) reductase [Hyphomicrobiales bacterium]MBO6955025.1 mercury(II) reductase [Hyphomicrobiales bacterium]
MSGNSTFDVAVIGAGSAGFSAAITAADEGAQVALIGHDTIGGTCVNVGCVPSKALIRAAETLHIASAAERFNGIEASAKVTDWQAVVRQKQELVDDLRKAKYSDLLPAYNSVSYLDGKAAFSDDGTLLVDGDVINASKVIIATGARAALPSIKGIEGVPYLTSTTALELETLPESLLVIGAGYIGAEIAQVFARAGVKVTIISRRGLLPEAEPEIGIALTGYFEDEGITLISGISYSRIEQRDGSIVLTVQESGNPREISAEKVLVATGRTPNVESLNLDGAGIDTNRFGGVKVDEQMCTTRKNVYAAGDVTGRDQFVYMAAYGAKVAAKNAMKSNSLSYDNSAMPAVVFTDPQMASVGLTEAQAMEQYENVLTSILTLDNMPRALAARDTRGLIKLVADGETKKLLGAHILAPEGSDSIQTAVLAIKAGMTYDDLGAMIFPYLTTVEGLKLAAQTFNMDVKKLSCCAG